MSLYSKYFHTEEIASLFTDEAMINYMLSVEANLASAQAYYDVIPKGVVEVIVPLCKVEKVNISDLQSNIRLGGNAAIPLVQQMTQIIKNINPDAAKYFHYGATSQDIVDTALVLLIKDYLHWLDEKNEHLTNLMREDAIKYAETPMIGRTLYQQAKVMTFGVKIANWLNPIISLQERLAESKKRTLSLTLGGAIGIGNKFITNDVKTRLAQQLGLTSFLPKTSIIEIISIIAQLNQELGKIAKDIALLSQTEIGEVSEIYSEGKGGSSTMPHKRNPVLTAAIIANSVRIPGLLSSIYSSICQENERSAGFWHAQWEVIMDLLKLTAGSIENTIQLLTGLDVNENRMMYNINLTNGLVFSEDVSLALANEIGKEEAHKLLQHACDLSMKESKHLKVVLQELDISSDLLEKAFNMKEAFLYSKIHIENITNRLIHGTL